MSEKGTVLELMHGARDRWHTVRATVRERRDEARIAELAHRYLERLLPDVGAGPPPLRPEAWDEPGPAVVEALTRIWLAGESRIREEREVVAGPDEWSLGIVNGDRWWLATPSGGAVSNGGDPRHSAGIGDRSSALFDPSSLIPDLEFQIVGECRRCHRLAVQVHATPRGHRHGAAAGLELGAEGYDIVVDSERGVLLELSALSRGEPFASLEVLEVAFDEVLPDDTFRFVPPQGERVRTVRRAQHRRLTLEQAVREAPFPVWIPSRVPRGFEVEVSYVAAAGDLESTPTVFVNYVPDDGAHRLGLRQTAAGRLGWAAWTPPATVERNGQTYLVVAPGDDLQWQLTHVFAEREGTSVEITSDLELDTVLEIAESLVPAAAEPPRLAPPQPD